MRPETSPRAPLSLVARSRPWLALGFALPLVLFLWSLETEPGLHIDEAWVTHATHQIAYEGARPINGTVGYSGTLHLYLLAAVVRVFGERLLVFRLVSAAFTVLFVLAFMAVARMLTRGAPGWPWAGVLVASSPLLLLESRFTTEMTAFMPALLMGGLAVSLWALTRPRRWRLAVAALGGILMGLGCYTHAVAIIFVVAVGVGALAAAGRSALRHPVSWATGVGFVAGLTPRFVALSQTLDKVGELTSSGRQAARIADLPNVFPILAGVLNGDLLYLRFTGQQLWTVFPYATVALAGVAALRILAARGRLDLAERAALGGALTALVMTAVCTPQLSLRYFLAAAWSVELWLFVTVLVVRQRASPWAGRVATGVLAAVIVLNLGYVLVDFHVAFARTGGRPALFPLGARLIETSNHFVRTDRLYHELTDRGIQGALANDFIAWPLRYYERIEHRGILLGPLPVEVLPPSDQPFRPDGGFALVYYAGFEPQYDGERRQTAFDYVHAEEVQVGELVFRRDPSFDPNFRVFLSPGAWGGVRGAGATIPPGVAGP